jgi:hypothetical protein
MIAYCPLEDLEPPVQQEKPVVEPKPVEVAGLEETELNYVVMAFIVGVIILAVSDSIRA